MELQYWDRLLAPQLREALRRMHTERPVSELAWLASFFRGHATGALDHEERPTTSTRSPHSVPSCDSAEEYWRRQGGICTPFCPSPRSCTRNLTPRLRRDVSPPITLYAGSPATVRLGCLRSDTAAPPGAAQDVPRAAGAWPRGRAAVDGCVLRARERRGEPGNALRHECTGMHDVQTGCKWQASVACSRGCVLARTAPRRIISTSSREQQVRACKCARFRARVCVPENVCVRACACMLT
jgi:hypothetical protein